MKVRGCVGLIQILFTVSPISIRAEGASYVCPMHPGVASPSPGKCPLCRMELVPLPDQFEEDLLTARISPDIIPGRSFDLELSIQSPKSGERISEFVLIHEKLLHLFIIDEDLQYFAHVHPELGPNGTFTIHTILPHSGRYQLIADFLPRLGSPQIIQRTIFTRGYRRPLHPATLVADASSAKVKSGVSIELTHDNPVIAGRAMTFKVRLLDASNGLSISADLVRYLGAWAHVLIASHDLAIAIHVHSDENTSEPPRELAFETTLPRPGAYRMWLQFQRKKELFTIPFTFTAEELSPEIERR